MISADLIEVLLENKFSPDSIRKIIEADYYVTVRKASTEMRESLQTLKHRKDLYKN